MTFDDSLNALLGRLPQILEAEFGGPVLLGEHEFLTRRDRRHRVLRVPLESAPDGAPRTVVVKQTDPRHYSPEDPRSTSVTGVINDWAAMKFLAEAGVGGVARGFGGDLENGFVVMEDLGDPVGVDRALLQGTADEGETALLRLASAVADMHAGTMGKAERFRAIRGELGYRPAEFKYPLEGQLNESVGRAMDFVATVGVPLGEGTRDELRAIVDIILHHGPFDAYTHSDPCPDNAFVFDNGVRLIDFEYGSFGHALLDAAYSRALFPTCWCARAMPEPVVERIENTYRNRLAATCEAAADDAVYIPAYARAVAFWTMNTWIFVREKSIWEDDIEHGISTVRQRILARNAAFVRVHELTGELPAFAALCERLNAELGEMWHHLDPMPLFPAFGGPPASR